MGKVVMYSSVSVDGFIADENDQPGPLFDWLSSGDVPLDESGELKVSQTSYDYTRPYWDQIGAALVGRRVFEQVSFPKCSQGGRIDVARLHFILFDPSRGVILAQEIRCSAPVRRRPLKRKPPSS